MLIGINVKDTFVLTNHYKVLNVHCYPTSGKCKISIQWCAGILAHHLIKQAKWLGATPPRLQPEQEGFPLVLPSCIISQPSKGSFSDLSSETLPETQVMRALKDANRRPFIWWNMTSQKIHWAPQDTKSWKCKKCFKEGKWWPNFMWRYAFSFCTKCDGQDCCKSHVESIKCKMCHSSDSPQLCWLSSNENIIVVFVLLFCLPWHQ